MSGKRPSLSNSEIHQIIDECFSPEGELLDRAAQLQKAQRKALVRWLASFNSSNSIRPKNEFYRIRAIEVLYGSEASQLPNRWKIEEFEKMEETRRMEEMRATLTHLAVADLIQLGVSADQAPELAKALLGIDAVYIDPTLYKKPSSPRIRTNIIPDYGRAVQGAYGEDLTGGGLMGMLLYDIERPAGLEPNQEGFFFATNDNGRLITKGGAAVRPVYEQVRVDLTKLSSASTGELMLLKSEVTEITRSLIAAENRSADTTHAGYDAVDITVVTDANSFQVLNRSDWPRRRHQVGFGVLVSSQYICEKIRSAYDQSLSGGRKRETYIAFNNRSLNLVGHRERSHGFFSVTGRNPLRNWSALVHSAVVSKNHAMLEVGLRVIMST